MCMKTLFDCNIVEFPVDDILLFNDITHDLFPSHKQPEYKKYEFEN